MSDTPLASITEAIEDAEVVHPPKPRLEILPHEPDRTVSGLRDLLADAGGLYDRGVPVRLAADQASGNVSAQIMTADLLVMHTHTVCRPFQKKANQSGEPVETDIRLPTWAAKMYLDWRGEWRLPVLSGIASSPILRNDGVIQCAEGYDAASGMWQSNVPDLTSEIPETPTCDQALMALRLLRETFRTFCFADADTTDGPDGGAKVVDLSKPPGMDESAFLISLLTAVCRPSLHLAPGVLISAASISGAGAGKGLLARCMSLIAYGQEPHAVTGGGRIDEIEKRIASELIQGGSVLFLDNLNNTAFRSDLLASAITERPARVRLLGKSQMVPLNAAALVVMTGNGLTVSEDLARRFVSIELDPRTEDPEARRFKIDIKAEVKRKRRELLAALLTIWRWGRQANDLRHGRTMGSFETWGRWVRDPLMSLGCQDPAERVSEAKARDGQRQAIMELFAIWWERHGERPIGEKDLHNDVKVVLDPHDRGRQYRTARLGKLTGTRMAGFCLTRQAAAGTWGTATYALQRTNEEGQHRGHREHEGEENPMPPVPPMDRDTESEQTDDVTGSERWRAVL